MKTMVKYHTALDLTQTSSNDYDLSTAALFGSNGGWTKIAGQVWCSESYIDLTGLAIDDETIFPVGITCQTGSLWTFESAAPGDNVVLLDVITSVPVDVSFGSTDIVNWLNVGAGFPGSTLNFEHVLYMRGQRWGTDTTTNNVFPLKADEWQSGSMAPSASDRLYCYRVVYVGLGAAATSIIVPTGRVVLQVEARAEPDHEYIMRLKRSYDLQQSSDVD